MMLCVAESWGRVASAVTQRRTLLGLSKRRCATLAGLSNTTWSNVENGERVEPLTRQSVARTLGWPDDALDRINGGEDPATLPAVTPTAALSTEERLAATEAAIAELLDLVADIREHLGIDQGGR